MTNAWWLGLLERALKTLCQALIATLAAGQGGLNLLTVNWQSALGVAASAALLSVLTTLAGIQVPVVNRPVIYTPARPGVAAPNRPPVDDSDHLTQPIPQVHDDVPA